MTATTTTIITAKEKKSKKNNSKKSNNKKIANEIAKLEGSSDEEFIKNDNKKQRLIRKKSQ